MRKVLILTVFIVFAFASCGFGQWQKIAYSKHAGKVEIIGSNIFAAFANKGLSMSRDNGLSWKVIDTLMDFHHASNFTYIDSTFYAATIFGVFRSTDSGNSWKYVSPWPYNNIPNRGMMACAKNLLAWNPDHRIVISKDLGKTWDSSNIGLPATLYGYAPRYNLRDLTGFFKLGDKIICGSNGPTNDLYISYNCGESWKLLTDSFPGQDVDWGLVYHNCIFASYGSLFRSKDTGRSWKIVYYNDLGSYSFRPLATDGKLIITSMDNRGVLISKDSGENWLLINNGFGPISGYYIVSMNSTYAFCVTQKGDIYRRPLSEINQIVENEPGIKLSISFSDEYLSGIKIYPNPTTKSATVDFGRNLKNGSLKLYNMLGQEGLKIEGIYEEKVLLNRNKLPAGVYLYEVSEGGMKVASGKLNLE